MKALMKVAFFGSVNVIDSRGNVLNKEPRVQNRRLRDRFMRPMESSLNEFGFSFTGGIIGGALSAIINNASVGNNYSESFMTPLGVASGVVLGREIYNAIKVGR
jgi:hypothetical protein